MKLSRTPLSESDLVAELDQLQGWSLDGGMIAKVYRFDSYAAGVMFAAAAGQLADRLDHHPDLLIGYKTVRVSLMTHDAQGITAYDIQLARRIEAVVR